MSADFNPKECPIGIEQKVELARTKDKIDMAIQRLEEHIDNVKTDVNKGFAAVDEHFDAVDKRFDKLENQFNTFKEDLPDQIDSRIKTNNGAKALNIVKWVIVTLGGSITITVLTKLALQLFKLD